MLSKTKRCTNQLKSYQADLVWIVSNLLFTMRAKYFEADLVKKLNTYGNYTIYHVL